MSTRASAVRPANANTLRSSMETILRMVRGSWSLVISERETVRGCGREERQIIMMCKLDGETKNKSIVAIHPQIDNNPVYIIAV